jgi:putative sigma-54 modulation protein
VKKREVPITVTFRHMAPTEPLRAYAEKKLKPVAAILPGAVDAHVILTANGTKHRQSAEIVLHGAHAVLKAIEETTDLYAAIDLAVAKLDSQVRKAKGRVIEAPRRGSTVARRSKPSSTASA